jgi:hypothetical protein
LGALLAQMVEQRLRFLAPEQLGGMQRHQMVQVGGDHGAGIDHGVAHGLRLFAHRSFDPHRRQAEGRIAGGDARQRGDDVARIDGEKLAGAHLTAADFHALQRDAVAVRIDLEVVADVHGRRQEADLAREFLADALDASHQFAVGGAVDQRNQAIADFEPQRVDRRDVLPAGFLRLDCGNRGGACTSGTAAAACCRLPFFQASQTMAAASSRNAKFGMPGIMPIRPRMPAVM